MRRIFLILGLLVAFGGCMSTSPPEYARGLDVRDPRFNSAQCQEMRKQAATYDPNTVGQFAAGMAASPFGAKRRHERWMVIGIKCGQSEGVKTVA